MPRCNFFGIYPAWCSELPNSVVWCLPLTWGKFSATFSNIFCFFLSLLLLVFPLHICYTFCSCPNVLGYFVLFYINLCSYCFSLFEVSIEISSSSEILSSAMSSLLIRPSKGFFISVTVFLTSSISFWLLLSASITHLFFNAIYFIRILSILIIVLNSWSDNSNIPGMSGSDVCSVSSNYVFLPFGVPCNFFLLDRMYVVK